MKNNFEELRKNCDYLCQEEHVGVGGKKICVLNKRDCCEENCIYIGGEKEEQTTGVNIDIQKLINDAMEKKDRSVSILISPSGTSIYIQPYKKEKPRWIMDYKNGPCRSRPFKCSECGDYNDGPSPYCPTCGEKLAVPEEEVSE